MENDRPRNALVIGASRGIGRAVLRRLKTHNWDTNGPPRSILDLSVAPTVDSFCNTLVNAVDAVIFSAGHNQLKNLADVTPADLETSFNIHVLGPFRIIQHLVSNELLNRGSSIVFLSSLYSEYGRAGRLVYSTTKHATNGLVKNLAVELGHLGVKVNCVVPGFVDTELTRKNLAAYEIRALQDRIPLGRIADIDEVARFVLDLCEKNTYMNGQPLILDGGLMAGGFWND